MFYKSAAHLVSELSPEGAEPPAEEEGLSDGEAESHVKTEAPVIESDLTSGITAAFNAFKTQLEQHLTVSTHMVKKLLNIEWLINNFHGP